MYYIFNILKQRVSYYDDIYCYINIIIFELYIIPAIEYIIINVYNRAYALHFKIM